MFHCSYHGAFAIPAYSVTWHLGPLMILVTPQSFLQGTAFLAASDWGWGGGVGKPLLPNVSLYSGYVISQQLWLLTLHQLLLSPLLVWPGLNTLFLPPRMSVPSSQLPFTCCLPSFLSSTSTTSLIFLQSPQYQWSHFQALTLVINSLGCYINFPSSLLRFKAEWFQSFIDSSRFTK